MEANEAGKIVLVLPEDETDLPEPENSACVAGRILKDPQVREVAGGRMRTQLMLAVPRRFVQRKEDVIGEVALVPVVAWGAMAERFGKLGGQSIVRVQGRLRSWRDREKNLRLELQGEVLEVLEARSRAQQGSAAGA